MSFLGAQNSIALGVQGIIAIDTGTGTIAVVTDPYWPFVSTLLHGDGTNAAQNNTFLDGSTNNFTVTRNGNTTQGSFNPFVSTYPYAVATNGGSAYFDGTGDYLTVPDSTAFTLGTNDFTMECWINVGNLPASPIIAAQTNSALSVLSFYIIVNSSGAFQCILQNASGTYKSISGTIGSIVANTWCHVAFVRDGVTARSYVNGVQKGTVDVTGFTVRDSVDIFGVGGGGAYTGNPYTGYISNFRLVNGTCLYPSGTTFTPPTAPLTAVTNTALLLGMSNGAIYDNTMLNNLETVGNSQISTSTFKYGTGSVAVSGASNVLSTPSKTVLNVGAGDFTVECWVYVTSFSNINWIFGQSDTASTPTLRSISAYIDTAGGVTLQTVSGSTYYTATGSSGTVVLNTWAHVACVRDGVTTRVYVSGVQRGTASISTNVVNTSTYPLLIGDVGITGTFGFNGYIDDFRFTKGVCRYPSGTTFTPPTAAFPNLGPTYPSGTATQRAIFGYGTDGSTLFSITNIVSNTGVVSGDTTGVGTGRNGLAAAGYGGDKAIFGFGLTGSYVSLTNLVSNTGTVAADTTGVGTGRYYLAAAGYGSTGQAIFGYGSSGTNLSLTNLVSNTGIVATDTSGVGTARYQLAASSYGGDKAIFGYGFNGANLSLTNLVSNTGVVAANTTGVGTARNYLAAAGYGGDKAIFGYGFDGGSNVSITNLVSNTGVVASNTTGVGTARYALAAASYGGDKAIFGYGSAGSMTNLVSNTGVVASNTTGVGTARYGLAAAGFSFS